MEKDKITRNDFGDYPPGRRLVYERDLGTKLKLGAEHAECKTAVIWVEIESEQDPLISVTLEGAIALRDALNVIIGERS